MSNEKYLLLGASRGLGKSFSNLLEAKLISHTVVARKSSNELKNKFMSVDLANLENVSQIIEIIKEQAITRIIYFAGGGPYGEFEKKDFKDHMWAFNLNFLFPSKLLHKVLSSSLGVEQFVLIGSAIAEGKGDKMASSYSAAKHALKGLFESLKLENKSVDLRLYSPGYMDTDLLPKNASIRSEKLSILSPEKVAKDLYSWLQEEDLIGYRSPVKLGENHV